MKKTQTPIYVWIWVFSIFIFLQIVLLILSLKNDKEIKEIIITEKINYLEKRMDKNKFNVIIIGSSLVGDGVMCPNELNNFIDKKNINIIKIWQSGSFFNFFTTTRYINKIRDLKPNLVLIQQDIVYIDFIGNKQTITHYLSRLNRYILKYIYGNKEKYKYKCNTGAKQNIVRDTLNHTTPKRRIKTNDDIKKIKKTLKILKYNSINTILVNLPRPKEVEKSLTIKIKPKKDSIYNIYFKELKIKQWDFSKPMFYKYFRDYGHLNKEGREIYTSWLVDKINTEI